VLPMYWFKVSLWASLLPLDRMLPPVPTLPLERALLPSELERVLPPLPPLPRRRVSAKAEAQGDSPSSSSSHPYTVASSESGGTRLGAHEAAPGRWRCMPSPARSAAAAARRAVACASRAATYWAMACTMCYGRPKIGSRRHSAQSHSNNERPQFV
jgi:hypothetical protein